MSRKKLSVLFCLFGLIFLASTALLISALIGGRQEEANIGSLVQEKQAAVTNMAVPASTSESDGILPAYRSLHARNPDLSGWITIEGTSIDYPVMQRTGVPGDEDYYLTRDFNGDEARGGLPYLDARCEADSSDGNLLIYGHNMQDGRIFNDLLQYADRDFLGSHRQIHLDTLYEERVYEILGASEMPLLTAAGAEFNLYGYLTTESTLTEQFNEVLKNLGSSQLPVVPGEELLILSTCSYHVKDGRFVVIARRTQ